ncbi:MAG TPA: hypothetical protein PLB99_10990, partial [Thermotogota bacterium]|nr:hypothetical protein [Thermotogota bacterium]
FCWVTLFLLNYQIDKMSLFLIYHQAIWHHIIWWGCPMLFLVYFPLAIRLLFTLAVFSYESFTDDYFRSVIFFEKAAT